MSETLKGLADKLKEKSERDLIEICKLLSESINNCIIDERKIRPNGNSGTLRPKFPYKGLNSRFYEHGGPVVRDDNPYFSILYDIGFIDFNIEPVLASEYNYEAAPSYWYLSQMAVDFHFALEKERHSF